MAERVRVAIVGAGIGGEHLDAYRALSDRFEVCVIADLDRTRAEALLARAPGASYAESLDAAVGADVDLVDICLPPALHVDGSIAALAAGKHVICEKPLAPSLAEADRLAEAAAAAPGRVFPVFQYRFGPGLAKLRALIGAGLTGSPYTATLETYWSRDAAYYAVPWRGTWQGERGGAILGHAIHIHDLLSHLLGPVARVHADLATRVNDIETEDCAALAIRMASGALVTSSVTLGAATDRSRLCFAFEGLTAESGFAPYSPGRDDWTFTARAPRTQAEVDRAAAAAPPESLGFQGYLAAISETLRGHPAPAVTLADGRASIEFVTAVYASARTGVPVDLPLKANHPLYTGWLPS